ncbi:hypothetical protein MCEMSEM23_01971 [Rhabdaerophilaceae bacterium]
MDLRWRCIRSVVALAGVFVAGGDAIAQDRAWSANGEGREIVATDCVDCGDDIGMMITCEAGSGAASVSVPWVALSRGRQGGQAPLTITIGRAVFRYTAKMVHQGAVGFVPEFNIGPNDPLIAALRSGASARITFSSSNNNISLVGAGAALDQFQRNCFGAQAAGPATRQPTQNQPQPPFQAPPVVQNPPAVQPPPAQTGQPGQYVMVVINNALGEKVDYYSRDAAGNPQYIASIEPGQTVEQPSLPGIVLIFGVNGQPVSEYVTTAMAQQSHDISGAGGAAAPPPQAAPPTVAPPVAGLTQPAAPQSGGVAQAPAPAQDPDGAVWSISRMGGSTWIAVYGIPQTDASSIEVRCPAAPNATPSFRFLSAPQERQGTRRQLILISAGQALPIAATADANGFLVAAPGAEAGFLRALMVGADWIEVTANGQPAGRFLGLGASAEGTAFMSTCSWFSQ